MKASLVSKERHKPFSDVCEKVLKYRKQWHMEFVAAHPALCAQRLFMNISTQLRFQWLRRSLTSLNVACVFNIQADLCSMQVSIKVCSMCEAAGIGLGTMLDARSCFMHFNTTVTPKSFMLEQQNPVCGQEKIHYK